MIHYSEPLCTQSGLLKKRSDCLLHLLFCILLPQVAEAGVEQLPHVMRIIRQPDAVNEAYSFKYQLRPWPLCHVPQTAQVGWLARGGGSHNSSSDDGRIDV